MPRGQLVAGGVISGYMAYRNEWGCGSPMRFLLVAAKAY